MEEVVGNLSEQTARKVLDIIAPGSVLISITVPDASYSNYTHILTVQRKDGTPYQVVVHRYKIFGDYDRGEKARREHKTFELLNQHRIPAPEALYLDEKGDVLETPGIVTSFAKGSHMTDTPPDPLDWARKLARTLVQIHSISCGAEEQKFLLKGNAEASWVVKFDAPPHYMQEYPGGANVWQMMRDLYPKLQADLPVLLHIDYWPGNVLWHENEISAVIDWEEAAYGDPAVDLAYARMRMVLMGLPEAADEFLRVYESEMGRASKNLGFWELAASVRPMIDPVHWNVAGTSELNANIFLKFIEEAKKRSRFELARA